MPTAAEANKRTVDFGNTYLKPLLSAEPPVITKEQFKEILKSVVKSVAASYKGEALDSNPSPSPSPIPSPSPGTSPSPTLTLTLTTSQARLSTQPSMRAWSSCWRPRRTRSAC